MEQLLTHAATTRRLARVRLGGEIKSRHSFNRFRLCLKQLHKAQRTPGAIAAARQTHLPYHHVAGSSELSLEREVEFVFLLFLFFTSSIDSRVRRVIKQRGWKEIRPRVPLLLLRFVGLFFSLRLRVFPSSCPTQQRTNDLRHQ